MKGLKSKLITVGIGLTSLLPIKSNAQIDSNIEYIKSKKPSDSYVRLNAFYGSSNKIKGFTFLELYGENQGYYTKTTLSKSFKKNISIETQIVGINEPYSEQGFGISKNISSKNKKIFLNLSYYPLWISKNLKKIKNTSRIAYFASIKLHKNFNISSFGEVNILNEKGPIWTYGEISIDKKIKKWTFGYNPKLTSNKNIIPKITNRFFVRKTF